VKATTRKTNLTTQKEKAAYPFRIGKAQP